MFDRAGEIDFVRTPPLAARTHNRCYCCQMEAGIYTMKRLLYYCCISDIAIYELYLSWKVLTASTR